MSAIVLAVGIILILGAGLPSGPLTLPLWFGSPASQRGGMLPLHPGVARLAGLCWIALFFVSRKSDSVELIVAVAVLAFLLLAVAMVLGVNVRTRR